MSESAHTIDRLADEVGGFGVRATLKHGLIILLTSGGAEAVLPGGISGTISLILSNVGHGYNVGK